MRRILLPALLLSLVTATPAHADPSRDHRLIDNALYDAGPIPRSSCAEKPINRRNHAPTARKYVTFVMGCLDRVWSKYLAEAGIPYKKPKLKLLTKDPKKYCGVDWADYEYAWYCYDNREIMVVLDRTLLNIDPDDLYIFTMLAGFYGEHVQYLAGIEEARLEDSGEPYTDFRRSLLQSLCLSGAFTGSVYKSMPRDVGDWKFIVKQRGKVVQDRFYGRPASIAYWMNRGFKSRDPKYCNTWTAPKAKVA
ncbi:neutral zinc metallopeptidase [Herbidospora sp. NBRC 101105]|uniref:neutral zinc metallopeptidase n=1 Tax=Herbidospora sp. NBRC 101105 TaxID=3032195 RepID=UPI0024A3EB4E|nr:neutral zinc metallopeptidase [Herbidospora sp. NBRC 101105]GLX95924.1 hypothetical protein Hesp01_38740 [Herbidospora sp. NBRC 101105]